MHSESCKMVKQYIVNVMRNIFKLCLRKFKKVLHSSLCKLCLILVLIVVLYMLFLWKTDTVESNDNSPVIMWWTMSFPGTSGIRHCPKRIQCNIYSNRSVRDVDAYLFYGSSIDFDDMPLPRLPNDVMWGLYHEESPRNVEELMHEEVISLFNYSATFSRHSDVPFPLQYLNSISDVTDTKYFVSTQEKNTLLVEDLSPLLYIQTDCETATERDDYVNELMKLVDVDSYGLCLFNKLMPGYFLEDYLNKLNDNNFLHFVARYKFVIAIENGVCDDYITEKFWRAIKTGVVPIYFGSPTIRDWMPNNNSAILLEDYPTVELMSKHINRVLANDTLYESYLEHKTKRLITNSKLVEEMTMRPYQSDSLKTAEEFECYVCRKLHQRRNGVFEKRYANKRHYDCPQPISALNLSVNPANTWAYSYVTAKRNGRSIRRQIETY